MMYLNNFSVKFKSKIRVGRGIGSGLGKTSGRGHKGHKSRTGYSRKIGFEGGQTPLHKRLPKFGFKSINSAFIAEIQSHLINDLKYDYFDLKVFKSLKIINNKIKFVKIIYSSPIIKPICVKSNNIFVSERVFFNIKNIGGSIN